MFQIGYLGLSRPQENYFLTPSLGQFSALHTEYMRFVEQDPIGQGVKIRFENEPRLQKFVGKMISHGGASRFEFRDLAQWYCFNYNEYGKDEAERRLENFINKDKYNRIQAVWIAGVTLTEAIVLDQGYSIVPVTQMPLSDDRDMFRYPKISGYNIVVSPQAAVIKEVEDNIISPDMPEICEEHIKVAKRLHDIAMLINCIENAHCSPNYSTSYSLEAPFWPFNGRGGGIAVKDVIDFHSSVLRTESAPLLNRLIARFVDFPENKRHRYLQILSRLSQAKRRPSIEDKVLDLAIALEMILLGKSNKEQLALSFRLRGSYLIGETVEERTSVYQDLKNLYTYRSEVAHSGLLRENNQKKIEEVRERFPQLLQIADRIVQKAILDELPDWDNLILGAQ